MELGIMWHSALPNKRSVKILETTYIIKNY